VTQIFLQYSELQARITHELVLRDCEDERTTGQPQGLESEAYLNSTSQGSRPEDARKDVHIIRARSAPLSPASGFPVSQSEQSIHELSGLLLMSHEEIVGQELSLQPQPSDLPATVR
jgi:hypothetical protein